MVIWEHDDVLRVPSGALFRDGEDWAVFVATQEDTVATFRRVTLGQQNNRFAQVLDGLVAGDEVILHPSDKIADGTGIVPRNSQ